ncbi:glycoside hydrolase family 43 protein [Piedraia hortae CBS 480.64]|uniref:Glycoside hydrolase family 43 protein n=1 Tax=Piedraia hortae CBS 480.64 TaxID=1314780 RepID=A0A6A7BSB5_9PEZI|nr:glycoside hydrolase family 43 protein [Piedraia hortae CBS 480.64]
MLALLLSFAGVAVGAVLGRPPYARPPFANHTQSRDTNPHLGTNAHVNIALSENFPDPCLVNYNGTFVAFASNTVAGVPEDSKNLTLRSEAGVSNVQIATSTDLKTWNLLDISHDPLPKVGAWAVQGNFDNTRIPKATVWAPSVMRRTDGRYILYYSAYPNDAINATAPATVPELLGPHPPPHCIGAAVSRGNDPYGPYDPMDQPISCPIVAGGAIDADAFLDPVSNRIYVSYKIDGNNIGNGGVCGNTVEPVVPTPLMLQKMQPDGVTPDGTPIALLDRQPDDGPLIEAPAIARSPDGTYFLFYSSGCTRSPTYDIKYATSMHIEGPYERAQSPLLRTGDLGLHAPGSIGVRVDENGHYDVVFHARVQPDTRAMYSTKLMFKGNQVEFV